MLYDELVEIAKEAGLWPVPDSFESQLAHGVCHLEGIEVDKTISLLGELMAHDVIQAAEGHAMVKRHRMELEATNARPDMGPLR